MKFEEKLIKLVKESKLLYHPKDSNYRRLDLKEKKWVEIGESLGVPEKKCKQRWRSLRDRFKREWKLQQKKSENGLDKNIVWRYYHSLTFLKDIDDGKINIKQDESTEHDNTMSPINFEDLVSKTVMDGVDTTSTASNIHVQPMINIQAPEMQQSPPKDTGNRKKKDGANIHDEFKTFLNSTLSAIQKKHPTEILFESLATKIINAGLPTGVQNQLEIDIFNLVYEKLLQYGTY